MEQSLTCVIIDNEAHSIEKMESLIEPIDWLALQSSFTEPIKAATAIIKQRPDIIFLDLQMPHMDGYAWLDWLLPILRIKNLQPQIVAMSTDHLRPTAMLDQFLFHIPKKELQTSIYLEQALRRHLPEAMMV